MTEGESLTIGQKDCFRKQNDQQVIQTITGGRDFFPKVENKKEMNNFIIKDPSPTEGSLIEKVREYEAEKTEVITLQMGPHDDPPAALHQLV